MHRKALGIVVAALLVSAGPVSAQGMKITLGGGVSSPVSDYHDLDSARTGWMGMLGVTISLPMVGVRLEGLYGENPHEGTNTDKTQLYGGAASVLVHFPLGSLSPYLVGSAGYLDHHYSPGDTGAPSSDEWKGVFGGGLGLSFGLAVVDVFIEGRYLTRSTTRFVLGTAGIQIGI